MSAAKRKSAPPPNQTEVVREWSIERAEHTVHGQTYDVVEFDPSTGSTGAIIARLHPSVRGVQGKEGALPIVRERALKMAAARELYAACEQALEAINSSAAMSYGDVKALERDDRQAWVRAVKQLSGAIAKARGGA